MIKITNNCNDFLQAYASANSGEGSGSNKHGGASVDKVNNAATTFNQPPKSNSHVRFNSLVDVNKKFKKHKKLKLKHPNESNNSLTGMRSILGKVDTNAQYGQGSSKYFHDSLNQTQNILLNNSDPFRGTSEENELIHYTYDNFQEAQ